MSPSTFPWWGWVISAVVVAIVSRSIQATSQHGKGIGFSIAALAAVACGMAGLLCFLIGVFGFIKWVWGS